MDGGADPNLRDNVGYTALHFAIEQASDDVACLLIDQGAQVECTDFWTERTPLLLAAIYGNELGAQLLLKAGAMVDRPSPHIHRTPLHVAAAAGHADLVGVLLQNGANVHAKDHHGSTPLHLCVGRYDITLEEQWDYVRVAQCLIKAGADINSPADVDADTPLHAANRVGNTAMVELLLKEGADPDIVNDHGVTYHHCKTL
jgi:ankyrin repeat protein